MIPLWYDLGQDSHSHCPSCPLYGHLAPLTDHLAPNPNLTLNCSFFQLTGVWLMMVRHYKSKTNKGNYSADKVDDALHAVRGGMSVKKAVTVFKIPRTTLHRTLASGVANKPVNLGRFWPVFNHNFECELVMHAVSKSSMA